MFLISDLFYCCLALFITIKDKIIHHKKLQVRVVLTAALRQMN